MRTNGRVLTCVYCGHEYSQETPAWGDKVLTDHIAQCEKHPMKKVCDDYTIVRKALVGLIGADGKELDALEVGLRMMRAPEQDQINALNAVHALRKTYQPK